MGSSEPIVLWRSNGCFGGGGWRWFAGFVGEDGAGGGMVNREKEEARGTTPVLGVDGGSWFHRRSEWREAVLLPSLVAERPRGGRAAMGRGIGESWRRERF
ncbi:hypothetical protein FXO38_36638 [Capsicum annuum]|nr:hypothetical protein FXO38_36638 [Capsicum annuum]